MYINTVEPINSVPYVSRQKKKENEIEGVLCTNQRLCLHVLSTSLADRLPLVTGPEIPAFK